MEVHERYDQFANPSSLSVVPAPGAEPIVLVASSERDASQRQIEVRHGNGVVADRSFDPVTQRLVRMTTTAPAGLLADVGMVTTPGGLPLEAVDLSLQPDRAPGIVSATRRFTYDRHARLVGAEGLAHSSASDGLDAVTDPEPEPEAYAPYQVTYDYDAAGNLIRNTEYSPEDLEYDAEWPDWLVGTAQERGGSAYAYDARGNAVATPRNELLAYDHRGCLRYAETGGAQVHLRYHDHRPALRITRSDGVSTLTAWLGAVEYVAVRGPAESSHVNVRTPGGLVRRVLSGPGAGDTDVRTSHPDEIGSLSLVTDDTGALVDQETYFPYGRTSDRRADLERPRFLGVDRDPTTGLCLTGPRVYDPAVGRFLQPDLLAAEQPDWSPYSYAMASPLRFTDRSGNQPWLLPGLIYATVQSSSPVELPPMEEVTAEQWVNCGAYAFLEVFFSGNANVANAPTGESVDEWGDPFAMTLGVVGAASPVRMALSASKGVVSLGVQGLLRSTMATPTVSTMRASSGVIGRQTYGAWRTFHGKVWRPQYPLTRNPGYAPGEGFTSPRLTLGHELNGEVTVFEAAIRDIAASERLSFDDVYWQTVRHEWVHRQVSRAANALGLQTARNNLYDALGRARFYEEFAAETWGKGWPSGVAQNTLDGYHFTPLARLWIQHDLQLASGLGYMARGGLVMATGLAGATLGAGIGASAGMAYHYFLAAPPPIPVLPPISLP